MGFIAFVAGLVADLIAANRQLLEMTFERIKRIEHERTCKSVRQKSVE